MEELEYMRRALALAEKGAGRVSPNPMVGAVIVKDGRVIGEGYHERYGDLHAERNALKDARLRGEDVRGASIYVTLEPCCHHGKQPPCTDALIEAGISRVFVGSGDPNPKVAGRGLGILKEHGIEVIEHVLEEECLRLNEIFFHYITTGEPFVCMKYAMTMDGKTACFTGRSRWVTGEEARRRVHMDRNRYASVMVGVSTVLKDDPLLTCRIEGGRDPARIVVDSRLRTPLDCSIMRTAKDVRTIIATASCDSERAARYEAAGAEVLRAPAEDGRVSLRTLMTLLGEQRIDSVILEGGGTLAWSAVRDGLVHKVQAYIAPKLFGGAGAKTPVEGEGFPDPSEAVILKNTRVTRLGNDLLMESEVG